MPIDIAIALELIRPLPVPDTPYRQCEICQHVAIPSGASSQCPGCNGPPASKYWPEVELIELWNDEVNCWNHEQAELAVVVAAMYFEASVFTLLYWGTCWLDAELNWIGAEWDETHDKSERIQAYLNTLRNQEKTDEALRRVFGAGGKQMLESVLGDEARTFWTEYCEFRKLRNLIAHRGKRIYYTTIPEDMSREQAGARDRVLHRALRFIPECWAVFRLLWNEYIYKSLNGTQERQQMTAIKPGDYFKAVILRYNKPDIEELLASGTDRAGPLLACVVNGIDAMGGLLYGYRRNNSASRSISFMTNCMRLPEDHARLIYTAVRCGLAHQAVTKSGVAFHVSTTAAVRDIILCRASNGDISVDVRSLARKYLDTIAKFNCSDNRLEYAPDVGERERALIVDVAAGLSPCEPEVRAEERSSIPQDFGPAASSE